MATGKETSKLEGHGGNVYSVSISPDGKTIVSGSNDKTIR
jgi:WD40 repeat protein